MENEQFKSVKNELKAEKEYLESVKNENNKNAPDNLRRLIRRAIGFFVFGAFLFLDVWLFFFQGSETNCWSVPIVILSLKWHLQLLFVPKHVRNFLNYSLGS